VRPGTSPQLWNERADAGEAFVVAVLDVRPMVRCWWSAAAITAVVSVIAVAPATFSAVVSAIVRRSPSSAAAVIAASIFITSVGAARVVTIVVAVVVAVAVIVTAVVPLVIAVSVSSSTVFSPSVEQAIGFAAPARLVFLSKPP